MQAGAVAAFTAAIPIPGVGKAVGVGVGVGTVANTITNKKIGKSKKIVDGSDQRLVSLIIERRCKRKC